MISVLCRAVPIDEFVLRMATSSSPPEHLFRPCWRDRDCSRRQKLRPRWTVADGLLAAARAVEPAEPRADFPETADWQAEYLETDDWPVDCQPTVRAQVLLERSRLMAGCTANCPW